MVSNTGGRLRRIGKFIYSAALMGVLAYGGYSLYDLNLRNWSVFFDLRPGRMAVVALASMLMIPWIDRFDEWLKSRGWFWTEWSVFSRNINFVPMDYSAFRIPFVVLLFFNLPVLAWIEEKIFRGDWVIHETSGFTDALWRSAVFSLLHVVSGTKLRTVLPLMFCGMWFSWNYLYDGIGMATMAHLAMNVAGLTTMLVSWLRTGKNPFSSDPCS